MQFLAILEAQSFQIFHGRIPQDPLRNPAASALGILPPPPPPPPI